MRPHFRSLPLAAALLAALTALAGCANRNVKPFDYSAFKAAGVDLNDVWVVPAVRCGGGDEKARGR